jgi:hypothetical protein
LSGDIQVLCVERRKAHGGGGGYKRMKKFSAKSCYKVLEGLLLQEDELNRLEEVVSGYL